MTKPGRFDVKIKISISDDTSSAFNNIDIFQINFLIVTVIIRRMRYINNWSNGQKDKRAKGFSGADKIGGSSYDYHRYKNSPNRKISFL